MEYFHIILRLVFIYHQYPCQTKSVFTDGDEPLCIIIRRNRTANQERFNNIFCRNKNFRIVIALRMFSSDDCLLRIICSATSAIKNKIKNGKNQKLKKFNKNIKNCCIKLSFIMIYKKRDLLRSP